MTFNTFADAFRHQSRLVYETAKAKGWWDQTRNNGELIALIHSELSEALEGLRHGNPPSDKIPRFSQVEEELADVVIRIMDMAQMNKWDVGQAVIEKAIYNESRPHRHGGKRF